MGGGDIKFMAGIGSFIGIEKVFLAVLIAALAGSIVGLCLIALKKVERRGYMPFGPFLSSGTFITIFIQYPSSFFSMFFIKSI
ncbi:MAG: A24 family peptidase [Endomicrobium sp.]|jgi:leader peptidase (prepilin peptidase)/N-methyltransferase|nr:A24 family peptidase [Endomicrobium sp.]